MQSNCEKPTSGGKGNAGMFFEREPRICAAGVPTKEASLQVADSLQHYLLADAASALVSDKITPYPAPRPLPPLRRPAKKDMRHASYTDMASLINPPDQTKFQSLVDDFRETPYSSYWKKQVGKVRDPIPMLPEGFDFKDTTFGKKTEYHGRLYDIVMPKVPLPDKTPRRKQVSVQFERNYCRPAFDEDLTYGYRTFVDKRGTYARCCLTDDKALDGAGNRAVVSTIKANYQEATQPVTGSALCPYDNISNVPDGYAFGKLKQPDNLPQCFTNCELNPDRILLKKCLAHLNTVRKGLSKRFLPGFFNGFYLNLKHFDKEKSGWLPKEVVYKFCASKLVRFDPSLMEPLLSMWNGFDGSQIDYKIFVRVINFREPSPEIPKIKDLDEECLDFRTTYTEMVKPNQEPDNRLMAGIPSGRYFDKDHPVTPENCCKADRTCLPHESDMKSCLNPSILTLMNVDHRDMYAPRDQATIRKVFDAAGHKLTDERFNFIWIEARKMHSQGLVCYETFRKALKDNPIVELIKKSPLLSY